MTKVAGSTATPVPSWRPCSIQEIQMKTL